jgi:hypothetical protein
MSGVIAKAKAEFGHAPVGFTGALVAMADVLFRILEPILFQTEKDHGTSTTPAVEGVVPSNRGGAILVVMLCLVFLSQNLIAYANFRSILWFSKLAYVASAPLTFASQMALAYLTEYNILTFTLRVATAYGRGHEFTAVLFTLSSILAATVTVVLTALFLDDSQDDVYSGGVAFAVALYLAGVLIFGIVLSPV